MQMTIMLPMFKVDPHHITVLIHVSTPYEAGCRDRMNRSSWCLTEWRPLSILTILSLILIHKGEFIDVCFLTLGLHKLICQIHLLCCLFINPAEQH